MMVFLQNPPPITISGQITTSALSNDAAERQPAGDLCLGAALVDKMRTLPGFLDVNSATCRSRARR